MPNNFNRDFQLNNKSFSSIEELLSYTNNLSKEIYDFLKEWFYSSDFIIAKTSGSTGTSKKIRLKKKYMINSAIAIGEHFNLPKKTKALLCLSVNFIAGKMMLVRALTLGWHIDTVEVNSHPLKGVKKNYDFVAMIPLQLEKSIDLLNKIKLLIVGGGAVSYKLQQKIQQTSCNIFATYGMTETASHIAIKRLNNFTNKPNFYKVLYGVEIYKDMRNCLVVNYPLISDKIIFTNDIVELISDKEFNWLGRLDNVINSGGVKLFPEIIEEKLSKIIKDRFFIAGVLDERLGERLVLIIESNNKNIKIDSANLLKYETPREIHFIESFVETNTKKINRKKTLQLIYKRK